ncbi:hypothetical protein CCACVL1_04798 [Corchorus capsularis]|uniref:AP2/ERF domain-containing protein n=1 Tax=Corchorus capsularis TaxID=210143 RepID=A0A1R3JPL3_COCAP|nr:hypothetical protein CCACVL1_04798 [Corchorus capsularis]
MSQEMNSESMNLRSSTPTISLRIRSLRRSSHSMNLRSNSTPTSLRITRRRIRNSPVPSSRRRPVGIYSAEIRHPFTNDRVFLGPFSTDQECCAAYQAKRREFSDLMLASAASAQENNNIIPSSSSLEVSPSSVTEGVSSVNLSEGTRANNIILFPSRL